VSRRQPDPEPEAHAGPAGFKRRTRKKNRR